MDIGELNKLQFKEDERAFHQSKMVRRKVGTKGRTWAVHEIYADKISLPLRHVYHQCGSIDTTAFLNEKTIVEIFPYSTPAAFQAAIGMSVPEVEVLAREEVLAVLIHSYPAYEGLDYLDPILSLEPPSYQSRGRAFLNAVAGGLFDESFERGQHCEYLTNVSLSDYVREPYEKGRSYPVEEIRRKTVWRYAAMCCLLGQDVMDLIIDLHCEKAPNYINELHTVFLHPITHGILGDPFNSVGACRSIHHPKYVQILDSLERILIDDIGIKLPHELTLNDILRSHQEGLAQEFSILRASFFREIVGQLTLGKITPEKAKAEIEEQLANLGQRMVNIKSTMKVAEKSLALGLLIGGTVCLSIGLGTVGALLYGSMATTPYVIEPLARSYAAMFDPAVSHYWKLREAIKKID